MVLLRPGDCGLDSKQDLPPVLEPVTTGDTCSPAFRMTMASFLSWSFSQHPLSIWAPLPLNSNLERVVKWGGVKCPRARVLCVWSVTRDSRCLPHLPCWPILVPPADTGGQRGPHPSGGAQGPSPTPESVVCGSLLPFPGWRAESLETTSGKQSGSWALN